jgi:hypothetical protein
MRVHHAVFDGELVAGGVDPRDEVLDEVPGQPS